MPIIVEFVKQIRETKKYMGLKRFQSEISKAWRNEGAGEGIIAEFIKLIRETNKNMRLNRFQSQISKAWNDEGVKMFQPTGEGIES